MSLKSKAKARATALDTNGWPTAFRELGYLKGDVLRITKVDPPNGAALRGIEFSTTRGTTIKGAITGQDPDGCFIVRIGSFTTKVAAPGAVK